MASKISYRSSVRKRVKCVHVDEPADLARAERLFARLCSRMLLRYQRDGQRSEEDPGSPKEEE